MDKTQVWLAEQAAVIGLSVDQRQVEQLERYYRLLVEWNEKMNLTGITERKAVYEKHFYDSMTVAAAIRFDGISSMIDVGSGAGFPSIPLKIVFPTLAVTIVDALAKRIRFLEEVVSQLELENVRCVHGRAEDLGRLPDYRDQFDLATARAVARLTALNELCLPFVRRGGFFVAMKGADAGAELDESAYSLGQLKARLLETKRLMLPNEQAERHLIVIEKLAETPKAFPRKAGIPLKSPLTGRPNQND